MTFTGKQKVRVAILGFVALVSAGCQHGGMGGKPGQLKALQGRWIGALATTATGGRRIVQEVFFRGDLMTLANTCDLAGGGKLTARATVKVALDGDKILVLENRAETLQNSKDASERAPSEERTCRASLHEGVFQYGLQGPMLTLKEGETGTMVHYRRVDDK